MTQTSAVIYIVRLESGPAQFLKQVIFFVGAFRGTQKREAVTPMLLLDVRQSINQKIKRLSPGNWAQFTLFS